MTAGKIGVTGARDRGAPGVKCLSVAMVHETVNMRKGDHDSMVLSKTNLASSPRPPPPPLPLGK